MIVGLTVLRQLLRFIPMKIHNNVATRAAPFGSDMHQIVVGCGFAPDPTGGAYSAPPSAGKNGPGKNSPGKNGLAEKTVLSLMVCAVIRVRLTSYLLGNIRHT